MSIFPHILPEAFAEAAIKAEQELTVTVQTATQMSHEEQAVFKKTEFHSSYTQTLLPLGNILSWFFSLAPGLISSDSSGEKWGE